MNAKATIRAAAVQFHAGTDIEENLKTTLRMLDKAAEVNPDLVVLPEFCNHLSWYDGPEHCAEVSATLDGSFLQAVADKAREKGFFVVVNCTVRRQNGDVTGSSLLYSPEGKLLADNTKQIYIGHENDFLKKADSPAPIVDTPVGRLGMYACMDGVINEPPRTLSLRGAQVLCNSVNSFASDEGSLHIPVRAPESRVFIVAANKVGPLVPEALLGAVSAATGIPEKHLYGSGESQIVAPDGTVLACASKDQEEVVWADIEPAAADSKLRPDGTDVFACRRPELYQAIAEDPAGQIYPQWLGADKLAASMISVPAAASLSDAGDAAKRAVDQAAAAVARGARLIGLSPLLGAELIAADVPAAAVAAEEVIAALAAVCGGATGSEVYVATALPLAKGEGCFHYCAVLIGADGLIASQPQVHRSERFAWSELAAGFAPVELPFARLGLVTSDDSIYPETFRLLAFAGVDTAVVPVEPLEAWELRTGLLERSAENRINLLAPAMQQADGSFPWGVSFATALQREFTVMTEWKERPFEGLLSEPEIYAMGGGDCHLDVTLYPACAENKEVSRNTDLVRNRPWELCGPIAALSSVAELEADSAAAS
ncbi:hydrolase [Microbulbifer bruguierae]|uniref:Hydrolase n=1 Tax=Microbulbifer bruguierae TaxID=3029061 RepID=A0ABY8ND27_9GAMM|nr:nitrilase-related carbon-nitrogen hydrolase [Microbulbifer bruguierae]WGL16826.1 hydrolase [Microbulbifer bruguierae]